MVGELEGLPMATRGGVPCGHLNCCCSHKACRRRLGAIEVTAYGSSPVWWVGSCWRQQPSSGREANADTVRAQLYLDVAEYRAATGKS